jgi:hypothetical protein
MGFPFTQSEWKEILTLLYKRAAVDHQFHILCTRDAHAAIKLICGKEIPKHIHIRFEPLQPDEIVLVLPRESHDQLRRLSDKDLETIANGMATICVPISQTLPIHQPGR